MKEIYKLITYFVIGVIFTYTLLEIKNKCFLQNDSKKKLNMIIKILVRQASRWSTAALQDKSPLIAVLHANYGAGYLWALKDIASNSEIQDATGINFKKFEYEIVTVLDKITKNLVNVCPDYAPTKSYLTKISGEG